MARAEEWPSGGTNCGSQVSVEHYDTDGDRSVFHIDGGALIWELNGRPYAVVTKLTCNFEQRTGLFEVRNQNGGGSADYPEGVVRALKQMATMAGVNLAGDGWSHVAVNGRRHNATSGSLISHDDIIHELRASTEIKLSVCRSVQHVRPEEQVA